MLAIVYHLVLLNCVKYDIAISAIYQNADIPQIGRKKKQINTSVAYQPVRHKYIISGVHRWYATNICTACRIYQWRTSWYATNNI